MPSLKNVIELVKLDVNYKYLINYKYKCIIFDRPLDDDFLSMCVDTVPKNYSDSETIDFIIQVLTYFVMIDVLCSKFKEIESNRDDEPTLLNYKAEKFNNIPHELIYTDYPKDKCAAHVDYKRTGLAIKHLTFEDPEETIGFKFTFKMLTPTYPDYSQKDIMIRLDCDAFNTLYNSSYDWGASTVLKLKDINKSILQAQINKAAGGLPEED